MAIPDLYDEPAPLPLVKGVIANTVTAPGQDLYVIIPTFDQTQQWGPCPWQPHGTSYPTAGAHCLIGVDEDGLKWVLQWQGPWT